jgi:hypothetical protein
VALPIEEVEVEQSVQAVLAGLDGVVAADQGG